MANSAGSISIDLEARIAKFESDLGRAARIADQRAKESQESWSRAAAFIGGGISIAGFTSSLKSAIDQMDDLSKSAQRVGVSTEVFSSISFAAKLADVSTEDLQSTLGKLIKNLAASQNATSQQAQIFKAMGIATKTASGNVRDSVDVLKDFADRFQDLKGDPDAIAAGMALFGKSFQTVIPLLKDGAAGISEAQAEADKLNQTIGSEAGSAAEQFNDNITRLQSVTQGFFNVLAAKMLPELDAWSDEVVDLASDHDKLNDAVSGITNTLEGLAAVGHTVAASFKFISAGIQSVVVVAASAMNQRSLLMDSLSHPFDPAELKADNAKALADAANLKDSLSGIWSKATDDINASFDAADKNFKRISGEVVDFPKRQVGAGANSFIDSIFGSDDEAQKRADAMSKALHGAFANSGAAASAEAKKAAEAYASAVKAIQDRIAADREALSIGPQVTEAEKARAKLIQDLTDGTLKVSSAERAHLMALSDTDVELQKSIALDKQHQQGIADTIALTQNLTASLQSQLDQNEINNLSVGHGQALTQQLQAELEIRQKYDKQFKDLNQKATRPENVGTTNGIGGDDYNVHLAEIVGFQTAETEAYRKGIDDRNKLQADGMNGINAAMEDFMTTQQNNAKLFEDFTTNAIGGFSDAFASFVSGSESAKKAFGDLIDSMYKQALKFVANKAIQGLFDSFGLTSNPTAGSTAGGWGSIFGNIANAIFGGGGGGSTGSSAIADLGGNAGSWGSDLSSVGGGGYGILGAGYAGGGTAYPGSIHPVNENGPELFTYQNRDYLAAGRTSVKVTPIKSGGSGGTTYVTNIAVQPTSTRRTADQISQAVDRKQRIASTRNG